ncbi:MAG: hypothetical protein HWN67_21210 [Candidatus Helarchaeota archaeon]|nr:hypothetical protein [Candidatus Helarchaeota archaeon]
MDYNDNLRTIDFSKQYEDEFGFTHYVFTSEIFYNPKYVIPENSLELFQKFLGGGSREYPSDGNVPVDIAANEAKIILNKIKEISESPTNKFHRVAAELLKDNNQLNLLRGAIRLYLEELTTRDWRRKRATDDIDFWIPSPTLLEYVLKKTGWKKNKKTREWEKKVTWKDLWANKRKSTILIASNDLLQSLNFGSGGYLEGSSLKNIIKKKLKRGFDVDLSDIINVAIVNNIPESKDPNSPWMAIIECANMRDPRVTSNIISLSRYAYGIAYYIKRVGVSLNVYKDTFKNKKLFSDEDVIKVCKVSSHLLDDHNYEAESTRRRIYENLVIHERRKLQYSKNLYKFTSRVLNLLNSKYEYARVIFEISFF